MNITRQPTITAALTRANRRRWAAYTLADRAKALVEQGHIARGFRAHRASMRCHELARRELRSA
jgi:hypothetical protein